MEIIKIENLSFTYPNGYKKAIDGINLSVNKGEFITICGKSGCGKSTLLRHLKPLLSLDGEKTGTIYFDGKDIEELSQREQAERIGFVFQNPDNQIVTDKVWHELAFGLESLSYSDTEIRSRVSEMASFFGIEKWFYKDVSELSGGQKQLLNLASVMVMQPELIILDEPTSQLDPIAAQDFLDTIYKINRELGTTIIITEHRLQEIIPMSDRVVVMENGKIIADDIPKKVGEVLYKTDNDMFYALPSPMRIYYSKENEHSCPTTIREAREWLSQMPVDKSLKFSSETKQHGKNVIELNDIWFRYDKPLPDILKGFSLSLKEGEFYAIVGGNGSGKSTALSVIAGLEKPYRGKIVVEHNKKISMLPQNPQSLFVKSTVKLDLYDMLDGSKLSKEQKDDEIKSVVEFCELAKYLDRHPYDLSGGEQQRLALAKVLLTKPDIILLDEPTKGLDTHFKIKFANMLNSLKENNISILMVSHDIEFCAKYADRCGMLFDGIITSEAKPREFFAGKSFYTTSANKIARGMIDNAVLDEDIISAISGEIKEQKEHVVPYTPAKSVDEQIAPKRAKLSFKRIISGILFAILFAVTQTKFVGTYDNWYNCIFQIISIIFFGLAVGSFIPKKEICDCSVSETSLNQVPKRTLVSAFMVVLLIPLTILAGVYLLGDRKYNFISLLVIFEILLPFFMVFEGRKPKARELVILSALCGIAVAGRCAFYMLPEFKPVLAIIIISGICFGGEAGFLVGAVTGFVSNFFFGQSPYTPWQMFAFGLVGFVAGLIFNKGLLKKTKAIVVLYGFLATVIIYGGIVNVASVILFQPEPTAEMFISSIIMGFPYDMVHAISTAFFLFFITEPMMEKLNRIKTKYKF